MKTIKNLPLIKGFFGKGEYSKGVPSLNENNNKRVNESDDPDEYSMNSRNITNTISNEKYFYFIESKHFSSSLFVLILDTRINLTGKILKRIIRLNQMISILSF